MSTCAGGGTPYDGYVADYSLTVTSTGNPDVVRNSTITSDQLLTASAAGIAESSVIGPGFYVGQIITQTVVYSFGNNTDIFFQPLAEANFPDECIRLIDAEVIAQTGGATGFLGEHYRLHHPDGSIPGGGGTITVVYTYESTCTNTSQTVSPWAAAKSGNKYKYTGLASTSTFTQALQGVTISKSVNPTFLPTPTSDGGFGAGIAQWTVTFTNTSSTPG